MEIHIVSLALAAVLAPAPQSAPTIALAGPQAVVEVDTGKVKGDPSMLAWSPDGSELYLQTVERDGRGAIKSAKHYVVSIERKSLKSVDQQPAWAAKYWSWKAGQASPAAPAFKIAVEERDEVKRATAAVGDLAKGGGGGGDARGGIPGTSAEEAVAAQASAQAVHIYALKIKGETLGEWANEPVTVGVNFGWAPAPLRLIAYSKRDRDKRDGSPLIVLDDGGHKQNLIGASNAILPAWSDDGARLAWLERKDRRKFDLTIAGISTK